jgi:hypothetical protein
VGRLALTFQLRESSTDFDEIYFRVMKAEHDRYISFCSYQFEMKLKSNFIQFVIAKRVFLFTKKEIIDTLYDMWTYLKLLFGTF